MKKATLVLLVLLVIGLVATTSITVTAQTELKAGFIYVGSVGDYGYTKSHDIGRQFVEDKFAWLDTVYAENVTPEEVADKVDKFVNERNVDVIFTTSFGHMDPTVEAAERHPETLFFHCSGYKRRKNLGTYFAGLYQVYYLNGLMAGALTESNKLGYVGTFPTPEVKRQINAYSIGVKEVNPQATVHVRWLNSWVDPTGAKEATESLLDEGVDGFAFSEDTPTVLQTAQEHGAFGFGHYTPMYSYAEDAIVSGQIVNWGVMYADILKKVYQGDFTAGNLTDVDYWWLLRENAAILGAKRDMKINPKYVDELESTTVEAEGTGETNVYDLIKNRVEQMKAEDVTFDPYIGPVKDRQGNLILETGEWITKGELWSMQWAFENVVGIWPNEPDTVPQLIDDFDASDGEDGRSVLSWTNPESYNLAKVIVRRQTGNYPGDHMEGELVYENSDPTPGAALTYTDTGLTNDTTYYYAAFAKDEAGNWNDSVEAEDKNADMATPSSSPTISVAAGGWTVHQTEAFREVVEIFEESTGIPVRVKRVSQSGLIDKIQSTNPPDLVTAPQPDLLQELAERGELASLDQSIVKNHLDPFKKLGKFNGQLYGIFLTASIKSLVWYNPKQFERKGYTVPRTWSQMMGLTEEISKDGAAPWCIGLESGAASGWPGTDWIEDILLRTEGPETYDKWVEHQISWTDSKIKTAWEKFGRIVKDPEYTYGGPEGALITNFGDSIMGLFSNPPHCYMHRQGSFMQSFIEERKTKLVPGEDYDVFVLPPMEQSDGNPLLGGGRFFSAVNKDKGPIELVEFLASAKAQRAWVEGGGRLAVNEKVSSEAYTNPVTKKAARILSEADTFRYDASDMMPPEVGIGTFWQGVMDYVGGEDLGGVLSTIEQSADDAYGQHPIPYVITHWNTETDQLNPDLPCEISTDQILQAIAWWADETPVPNTGGKTIGTDQILDLIAGWADGSCVGEIASSDSIEVNN